MSALLGNSLLENGMVSGIPCRHMLDVDLKIPFLKNLTSEQLKLLDPLFETFSAPAGTTIFERGDKAVHLYLIVRGKVGIQYKPYDGPKITLTHLRAGDVFGWSSVVGNATYTSDVVSKTYLDTLRIRGRDLRQLCLHHPEVGRAILEKLAEAVSPRWRNAKDQIHDMLQNNVLRKE
ncbi:MAG: cyclic nucleotide-binding domain-containing protein [Chloroflexi bacterium]|nr:cyclic nucleotide-binding domain-containing protein [Chloroflexota bacterium]